MSIGERRSRTMKVWTATAVMLLITPAMAKNAAAHALPVALVASWQEQDAQDREQEARDREQEKRDREQEKRDREQEKRDREQEHADRLQELYDDGREALDDDEFDQAAAKFTELADMNGPQTDAALYWKAYALNKLAKKESALATIADFKKRFAQSKWMKDVGALEIEVKQSTGQQTNLDAENDEELKLLALRNLIQNDPERGVQAAENLLSGPRSPKFKSKVLFLIAQSGSTQARQALARIAKGESNPELQRKAVEQLGLFGGQEAKQTLTEIYASTNDPSLKRTIIHSFMISGAKQQLFTLAKSEKDESLRSEAIRQLGLVHAPEELRQLYQTESSPEVKKTILQAFFLSGDAKFLGEAAQNEKDTEVRRTAIHNLGIMGSEEARQALPNIYNKETDRENKETVLNALFIQGNAHALVAIARSEKDPELKKAAVSKLALMHSKEASDYLLEFLQK